MAIWHILSVFRNLIWSAEAAKSGMLSKPNTYYSSCYRYKKEYIAKIAVRIVTRCELSFALWIDAYVEGTMASSPGSSFSVRGRTDAYSDSDRNTQPDEEEVVVKMHSI
jgi:hypothetical protein